MRKIGIMGAMEIEIELIKSHLTQLQEVEHAGFKFYIGTYKNVNIVLCSCGVGKVNAASCTQMLIDKFQVTEIINTGIAGSLNSNARIGDTVISDNVTYHDVRPEQMRTLFPFVDKFQTSEELRDIAIRAFEACEIQEINYHLGRIVTGEAFINDSNLKRTIVERYQPLCVEMEGGAIGHVAHINNIPFLIIRSISDNADDDANDTYDNFEGMAARNSARLVINMLNIINDSDIKDSEEVG